MHNNDEYRESRKLAFEAAQTLTDKAKIDSIKNDAAQSFYRTFGKRLTPLMIERGIENILLSESATITIKGNLRQLPESNDRESWDRLIRKTAEGDMWLQASLVSSDQNLKAELRAECLASTSSVRQMTLARLGQLDSHVDAYTAERIEARLEALR